MAAVTFGIVPFHTGSSMPAISPELLMKNAPLLIFIYLSLD